MTEALHLQVKSEHLFFKTNFADAEFEEVNFNRQANTKSGQNLVIPALRKSSNFITTIETQTPVKFTAVDSFKISPVL